MSQATQKAMNLSDVLTPIGRRWRWLLVTTLIVTGAAVGASFLATPSYEATSKLSVNPIPVSALTNAPKDTSVNMKTEVEIVGSSEVAAIAAAALGDVPASTLAASEQIASPSQSDVLEITVTAPTAEAAAARANAVANAYLSYRASQALELASTDLADLSARIDAVLAGTSDESLPELRSTYDALSAINADPGQVIQVATAATKASSLGIAVYLVGGLVGGLLLGALVAAIRDRSIRSSRRPSATDASHSDDALQLASVGS